jgi:iron(III) transport system substrate-binding protein
VSTSRLLRGRTARRPGVNRLAVAALTTLTLAATAGCGGGDSEAAGDDQKGVSAASLAESCGGEEADWDTLITDAQEEGTVVVAGPPNPDVSELVPNAFTERFGIDVEYIAGSSGETAQKIASEREADLHTLDIFLAGGNTMSTVIYGGEWLADLSAELVSPDLAEPEVWRGDGENRPFVDEPGGNTIAQISIQGQSQFIVNSDLVGEDEITGWKDLLDPKWKGKIVAMDPTTGSGLGYNVALMLTSTFGRDFVKELYVGQEVVLQTDDRQAADGVARGQYAAAIGVSEANGDLGQLIADGLPVRVMASPEDAPTMVSAGYGWLGLLEPAAHPAAAKLFANWVMCPDGNQVWNEANGYESARTDVEIEVADYIRADTEEEYWDTYEWSRLTSDETAQVLEALNEDLK